MKRRRGNIERTRRSAPAAPRDSSAPPPPVSPVCVAGMHRSGTSMVTRLLHECGLYLGEAADLAEPGTHNPDGYWENLRFVEINDDLLGAAGGGWDHVPSEIRPLARVGSREDLHRLRGRAATLVAGFTGRGPWGWKDPRNSLTLPFWDSLCPGLRVVVCVRNPLEVVLSLRQRNDFSYAHAMSLWAAYTGRLMRATVPDRRIVTHYDAFFRDAASELRRLCAFLGLGPSEEALRACVGSVRTDLRHNRFTTADLLDARVADDVLDLYARACEEAGWSDGGLREWAVARASAAKVVPAKRGQDLTDAAASPSRGAEWVDRRLVDAELMRRELNTLRPELLRHRAAGQDLEARLGEAAARATRLGEELARAREEAGRAAERLRQTEAAARELEARLGGERAAASRHAAELAARDAAARELMLRVDEAERRAAAAESARASAYQQMVRQVRDVVRAVVPAGATVLVASRGDDELLRLDGRPAWHFPRAPGGEYAGHYPADSGEAIGHLESLRAAGADYLVLPDTALWWLDHYFDFRHHLERRYALLARVDGACRVFGLRGQAEIGSGNGESRQGAGGDGVGTDNGGGGGKDAKYRKLLSRVRHAAAQAVPPGATVLVVSKGDDRLLEMDGRRGWHFPRDERGVYAGYHPADSTAAIRHLESLRAKGAEFLLLPASAFWWLDHYGAFRAHLDGRCERVWSDADCVIYRLAATGSSADGAADRGTEVLAGRGGAFTPPEVAAARPPSAPARGTAVDVVVCVHNALDDVRRCLESVARHTRMPYTLVLVDDGSGAETREYLREFAAAQGARLLRNDAAGGYTAAANRGLRESAAPYVVLLNSDTVVGPGWLDRMVACAESDAGIGLVGPLSNTASWQSVPELSRDGDWAENPLPPGVMPEEMAGRVARASGRVYPRLPFLNGFCLMIRRAVLQQVGYFDEENFGRGYGEENDYCVRARAAGWQLAVADDAYVFHAQSRSYSHDRRRQLCEHATEALARKHGVEVIRAGSDECRHSRVLEGVRARVRVAGERERLGREARSRWGGRRVLFLLPSTGPNGGCNVVLQEAAAMRRMGVDARVLNLSRNRAEFERNYPDGDVPFVYVDNEDAVGAALGDYDAAVATINASVDWMASAGAAGPAGNGKNGARRAGVVRGYYVQDFEPYFYVPGSEGYRTAWDSYARFPDLVRVTKTEWNREMVRDRLGVDCHVVGPSVDVDLYRPRPQARAGAGGRRPLRVAAMVRPGTPRRAPRLTMEVLRDLRRARGDAVEIVVFGCDADDPDLLALPSDFPWRCAGVLNRRQAAWLFNEVDIFADFSSFQAMGLAAMEAMACGAAVIVPAAGGSESFAAHEVNALVVDSARPESCLAAVERMVGDDALLDALRWRAVSDVCQFFPERAAFATLEALFQSSNGTGPEEPIVSQRADGGAFAAAEGRNDSARDAGRG